MEQEEAPGHSTLVRFRMEPASVASMVEEMRADVAGAAGMLRFDLNTGEDDPGAFFICARWADRESWQAHQFRPDYLAFRERTARWRSFSARKARPSRHGKTWSASGAPGPARWC